MCQQSPDGSIVTSEYLPSDVVIRAQATVSLLNQYEVSPSLRTSSNPRLWMPISAWPAFAPSNDERSLELPTVGALASTDPPLSSHAASAVIHAVPITNRTLGFICFSFAFWTCVPGSLIDHLFNSENYVVADGRVAAIDNLHNMITRLPKLSSIILVRRH